MTGLGAKWPKADRPLSAINREEQTLRWVGTRAASDPKPGVWGLGSHPR